MATSPIDDFAAQLVRAVRDNAIKNCDRALVSPKSPVGKRWQRATGREELARTIIPDCVDETIFWLLQAIDQEILKLDYTSEQGDRVDLCEGGLGELSGSFMGSNGWRTTYSQERYVDDFEDLA